MGRHTNGDTPTGTLFVAPVDPAFRRASGKSRARGKVAPPAPPTGRAGTGQGSPGRPGSHPASAPPAPGQSASRRSSNTRPAAGARSPAPLRRPAGPPPAVPPRKRTRVPLWTTLCLVVGTLLTLLGFGAFGAAYTLNNKVESNITRSDLLGASRSEKSAATGADIKGPLNFLLIGSDSRAGDNVSWKWDGDAESVPGERSDAIMMIHVPATHDRAYIVSVPRDARVEIPPMEGKHAGGEDMINAAYTAGGAPLLVSTLKKLGGIDIQYPVIIDFAGLRGITDAVDGVDVHLDAAVQDGRTRHVFPKGKVHLDGRTAEIFVRQRYFTDPGASQHAKNLRGGTDYDRQKRQQQYLRALAVKLISQGFGSPTRLPALLETVSKALTVDKSMPVQDLALKLSKVRPDNVLFYSLPHETVELGGQQWRENVKQPDAQELFDAMNRDTMAQYVLSHPPNDVSRGQ